MGTDLLSAAIRARENALASYSGFKVGAAIETTEGALYTGCNIENASLGLTVCAERVALWKALSEGSRDFKQIVVVSDSADPATPCGACRQLLWEYCGDIPVLVYSTRGTTRTFTVAELLPHPFDDHHFSTGRSD